MIESVFIWHGRIYFVTDLGEMFIVYKDGDEWAIEQQPDLPLG